LIGGFGEFGHKKQQEQQELLQVIRMGATCRRPKPSRHPPRRHCCPLLLHLCLIRCGGAIRRDIPEKRLASNEESRVSRTSSAWKKRVRVRQGDLASLDPEQLGGVFFPKNRATPARSFGGQRSRRRMAGIKIAIDAHTTRELALIRYGVDQTRRDRTAKICHSQLACHEETYHSMQTVKEGWAP